MKFQDNIELTMYSDHIYSCIQKDFIYEIKSFVYKALQKFVHL